MKEENAQAYWAANKRVILGCLSVWFLVSYVFGILLVDVLNHVQFFGFKLGFWFAQQGSILIFLGLIVFYIWKMNRIDEKFDVNER